MKTITIEIPEGKKAEWVNGVLTLVDEQPVEFKFKVGDRVTNIKYYGIYTVTRRFIEKGLPTYELRSIWGKSISSEIWLCPHVEPKDITERIKTFEDADVLFMDGSQYFRCIQLKYNVFPKITFENSPKELVIK